MKKTKSNIKKNPKSNNYYIAIMAGGIGSRFWPFSSKDKPKQFLDILRVGKSLLRLTFERFLNIVDEHRILVVTNKRYKELVSNELPELPDNNILCEPSRNNTGPSVAYTAFRLKAMNPNAIFVVAPSDHIILKENLFSEKIKQALLFVEQNEGFVTLGIPAIRPDTGYGYIETIHKCEGIANDGSIEMCSVKSFKEKPNLSKAKQYIRDGKHYWNAGIFVWKASTLLEAYKKYAKNIHDILSADSSKYNTTEEQGYIDSIYDQTPSISVDYAILEHSTNLYTLPSEIGWSDLGTWNSLFQFLEKNKNGSVLIGEKIYPFNIQNCIIRSNDDKIIVIKGLENYIVVNENDALLIYPINDEQEIKNIVENIVHQQ